LYFSIIAHIMHIQRIRSIFMYYNCFYYIQTYCKTDPNTILMVIRFVKF